MPSSPSTTPITYSDMTHQNKKPQNITKEKPWIDCNSSKQSTLILLNVLWSWDGGSFTNYLYQALLPCPPALHPHISPCLETHLRYQWNTSKVLCELLPGNFCISAFLGIGTCTLLTDHGNHNFVIAFKHHMISMYVLWLVDASLYPVTFHAMDLHLASAFVYILTLNLYCCLMQICLSCHFHYLLVIFIF